MASAVRWSEVSDRFGVLVKMERERRGWSQGELARRIGVNHSLVARWEMGQRSPSLGMIERTATALGVLPRELVGW